MLTHLTRRRAAAAITRLTVVAAARIQITFRVALRITRLHMLTCATSEVLFRRSLV